MTDIKEKLPTVSNVAANKKIIDAIISPTQQKRECDVKLSFEKLPPVIALVEKDFPPYSTMTLRAITKKGMDFVEHIKSNMPPFAQGVFEDGVGCYPTDSLDNLLDRAKRFGDVKIDTSAVKSEKDGE